MDRSPFELYLLNTLHHLGALGPWVAIPIYVAAVTLFVPGAILGMAAGATFGLSTGFLVFSSSATISAGLVFLAGRHFTRGWVSKKIGTNEKVRAVDDVVTQEGWKMVALLRLTFVMPYTVMNYGLGLSKIRFKEYIFATWLAMVPVGLLFVYLGSLAGEVLFEGRKPQKTPLEWVFFAVGAAVTAGITMYATKRVRKILRDEAASQLPHKT